MLNWARHDSDKIKCVCLNESCICSYRYWECRWPHRWCRGHLGPQDDLQRSPYTHFLSWFLKLKHPPQHPDQRLNSLSEEFNQGGARTNLLFHCRLVHCIQVFGGKVVNPFQLYTCLLSALARLALSQRHPASDVGESVPGESKRGLSGYIFVCLLWMPKLVEPHTSLSLHSSPPHSPLITLLL